MRALIVGASGFVGEHLVRALQALSCEVHTASLAPAARSLGLAPEFDNVLDITDEQALGECVSRIAPDRIYHLAAQSSVARSWQDPIATARINILGTMSVLEVARRSSPQPRVLIVGSSEEYGRLQAGEGPISETRPVLPENPYAVSKASAESFAKLAWSAYGLPVIMTRAFNHIGPGQGPGFVVPDFCTQIVAIERGNAAPVVKVGNLEAARDFTDVRDVVAAYVRLMESGAPGEIYNVGSGRAVKIGDLLKKLVSMSTARIEVVEDPARWRPLDVPVITADTRKITEATGWAPRISVDESLQEVLDYWRINM